MQLGPVYNIKKISMIFFAVLGLTHFVSSLMYTEGYFRDITGKVSRISFVPFVLACLFLFYSTVKSNLSHLENTAWIDYAFLAVGVVLLLGLLAIEFVLPDSNAYL